MDFPFVPPRARFLSLDFHIFACHFHFYVFFWHIFLRCLHILCIKRAKGNSTACTRRKKAFRREWERNHFCWIIFKDKKMENFREIFSFFLLNMWLSRESSESNFPSFGWKRYDYDVKAATCWKKAQVRELGYDGKINFPLSHFYIT